MSSSDDHVEILPYAEASTYPTSMITSAMPPSSDTHSQNGKNANATTANTTDSHANHYHQQIGARSAHRHQAHENDDINAVLQQQQQQQQQPSQPQQPGTATNYSTSWFGLMGTQSYGPTATLTPTSPTTAAGAGAGAAGALPSSGFQQRPQLAAASSSSSSPLLSSSATPNQHGYYMYRPMVHGFAHVNAESNAPNSAAGDSAGGGGGGTESRNASMVAGAGEDTSSSLVVTPQWYTSSMDVYGSFNSMGLPTPSGGTVGVSTARAPGDYGQGVASHGVHQQLVSGYQEQQRQQHQQQQLQVTKKRKYTKRTTSSSSSSSSQSAAAAAPSLPSASSSTTTTPHRPSDFYQWTVQFLDVNSPPVPLPVHTPQSTVDAVRKAVDDAKAAVSEVQRLITVALHQTGASLPFEIGVNASVSLLSATAAASELVGISAVTDMPTRPFVERSEFATQPAEGEHQDAFIDQEDQEPKENEWNASPPEGDDREEGDDEEDENADDQSNELNNYPSYYQDKNQQHQQYNPNSTAKSAGYYNPTSASTNRRKATYICSFPNCNKAFTRRNNLKYHMVAHSTEKPFVCEVCNAGFSRQHDLQRHTLRHNLGNLDFVCELCNRSFSRKVSGRLVLCVCGGVFFFTVCSRQRFFFLQYFPPCVALRLRSCCVSIRMHSRDTRKRIRTGKFTVLLSRNDFMESQQLGHRPIL
jgi:hypothetical protein